MLQQEQRAPALEEFAVPREQEGLMRQHRDHIQALFGVQLVVLGVLGQPLVPGGSDPQQIWLQLQGPKEGLEKAKNYIKGMCTPEIDLVQSYPKDMHCIFLGSEGLFLNGLVRRTSANISIEDHGALKISGLAVAVVMAQSLIQVFVDRYVKNPPLSEEHEVAVKRRFKQLVEAHHDRHSMDLLILPSGLKEELLDLVGDLPAPECRPDFDAFIGDQGNWDLPTHLAQEHLQRPAIPLAFGSRRSMDVGYHDRLDVLIGNININDPTRLWELPNPTTTKQVLRKRASRPIPELNQATGDVLGAHTTYHELGLPQTRPEVAAERRQKHSDSDRLQDIGHLGLEAKPIVAHEENWGLGGEIPKPRPFNYLERPWSFSSDDRVVQSSGLEKEFDMMVNFFKTMGYPEETIRKVLSTDGFQEPSRILDRLQAEQKSHRPRGSITQEHFGDELGEAAGLTPAALTNKKEYLLEVIKSAAKNCGYSPSEITEIQEGAPMANLLIKLNQRKEEKSSPMMILGSSSSDLHEDDTDPQRELFLPADHAALPMKKSHCASSKSGPSCPTEDRLHPKAGPFPKAHMGLDQDELEHYLPQYEWTSPSTPMEDVYPGDAVVEPAGAEGMVGVPADQNAFSLVTGKQRFEEVMQKPFQLNLKNEPGKDHLRHIIIDGSNVAMIHGLHQFFSCRGIALAVQHFWDRGHRQVTVFVPQWRMKKGSKVQEQHFLTQLNQLRLLSFTPSRTIERMNITSYDDRFLLQLAEKTEGVIVTNDNLRDCAEESSKWKEIIKYSLLQFTFVGDIFMVPDDPLGRHGPSLDEFLSKTGSTKIVKAHSSVRHRTHRPPPRVTSQTETLNLRDRKAGGISTDEQMAEEVEEEREQPRGKRETTRLRLQLLTVFKQQEVDFVLQREQCERDLNRLSELILNLKS